MKQALYFFFLSLILFLSLSIAPYAEADTGGDNHNKSLAVVLQEIRELHGVENNSDIDCEQLSDSQLEEIGEGVMSTMHPDPDQHEFMDRMMGGEGSASLEATHIMMGSGYLGCSGFAAGMMGGGMGMMGGGMGMTGGGMMGSGTIGQGMMGPGMMDNNSWLSPFFGIWGSSWYWILRVIFWLVVIVGIVFLVKNLMRKERSGESALDTLKIRYAKGDLSKKEFEMMKKTINE